jgi:hypothetical protein
MLHLETPMLIISSQLKNPSANNPTPPMPQIHPACVNDIIFFASTVSDLDLWLRLAYAVPKNNPDAHIAINPNRINSMRINPV